MQRHIWFFFPHSVQFSLILVFFWRKIKIANENILPSIATNRKSLTVWMNFAKWMKLLISWNIYANLTSVCSFIRKEKNTKFPLMLIFANARGNNIHTIPKKNGLISIHEIHSSNIEILNFDVTKKSDKILSWIVNNRFKECEKKMKKRRSEEWKKKKTKNKYRTDKIDLHETGSKIKTGG